MTAITIPVMGVALIDYEPEELDRELACDDVYDHALELAGEA
jgi:hypothetical protein